MPTVYDIAYAFALAAATPYWLLVPKARRKVLKALRERMGRTEEGTACDETVEPAAGAATFQNPVVMIHAVSLGEINATRGMVRLLGTARPDVRFVVSVTTETGHARGIELYGSDPRVKLIRYPLDFSKAIRRVLDRFRPSVFVLMELEVWPNFILHCHRRGIPVLLVNGRLTTYSFRNYARLRWLLAPTFRRLSVVCAQDRPFADRFIALGTPADRVRVTGTMKFDTAQIADYIEGQDELARSVGLGVVTHSGHADVFPSPGTPGEGRVGAYWVLGKDPHPNPPPEYREREKESEKNASSPSSMAGCEQVDPIWVCGSTGPGEELILLRVYRQLLIAYPRLRLVLVPRHPERFDAVAAIIRDQGFDLLRRSENRDNAQIRDSRPGTSAPVILGDTMGELRKFYSLATVVFVGRSLLDLGPRQHGSDMIEPAALAKPVVVGPWTHNFADAMSRFSQAGAMKIVASEAELIEAVGGFLRDPAEARMIGSRAQAVVRAQQGATARHVGLILQFLDGARPVM